jgi:hypothetical protein
LDFGSRAAPDETVIYLQVSLFGMTNFVWIQSYCCMFTNNMFFCGQFCKLRWVQTSRLGFVDQHCQSCNSTVNHVTLLLLMCPCCWRDVTALLIMRQCRRWCVGAVDVMQQHCWSWDCRCCCVRTVNVVRQYCWSCNSAVDLLTALSIMWQSHHWCNGTVNLILRYQQWKAFTRTMYPSIPHFKTDMYYITRHCFHLYALCSSMCRLVMSIDLKAANALPRNRGHRQLVDRRTLGRRKS